jgi:AcrR family transcriptional regulator
MTTIPPIDTAKRARARRGNAADHAAVRQQVVDAALRLHQREPDLAAISMRALAAEVGLSAMALYRYFDGKAALLQAMWEVVLTQALAFTSAALSGQPTARGRMLAGIEAFMRYWEDHPDHFRLVFMTQETLAPAPASALTRNPAYRNAVQLGTATIQALIAEVGGDPSKVEEARDLRMALMVGYLHARLVNRRFPWGDFDVLRANAARAIMLGVEACVRKDPPKPVKPVKPASRGRSHAAHAPGRAKR